jgi:hypothetical protein
VLVVVVVFVGDFVNRFDGSVWSCSRIVGCGGSDVPSK